MSAQVMSMREMKSQTLEQADGTELGLNVSHSNDVRALQMKGCTKQQRGGCFQEVGRRC